MGVRILPLRDLRQPFADGLTSRSCKDRAKRASVKYSIITMGNLLFTELNAEKQADSAALTGRNLPLRCMAARSGVPV